MLKHQASLFEARNDLVEASLYLVNAALLDPSESAWRGAVAALPPTKRYVDVLFDDLAATPPGRTPSAFGQACRVRGRSGQAHLCQPAAPRAELTRRDAAG